ncbi:hypothetical protein TRVL_04173 [Trypanosoma vivax]|nr:hypothetical protein TRVL_04173 [Trypanosoma vivax]
MIASPIVIKAYVTSVLMNALVSHRPFSHHELLGCLSQLQIDTSGSHASPGAAAHHRIMATATKRKIVYVPEEDLHVLSSPSNSPNVRHSCADELSVASSDNLDDPASEGCSPLTGEVADVDAALLISYDRYTLADGSGMLHPPPTSRDALELYKSLKVCCRFLRSRVRCDTEACTSTESSSVLTDSLFGESTCSSGSSASTVPRPRRRTTAQRPQQSQLCDYSALTVADLREILRDRGQPTKGNKKELISRLERCDNRAFAKQSSAEKCCPLLPEVQEETLAECHGGTSDGGESSGSPSQSPKEASEEQRHSTMMSAFFSFGSKLFRSPFRSNREGEGEQPSKRSRFT